MSNDVLRAYQFRLEIGPDKSAAGHFTSCTGLEIAVEAIRYREAGNAQVVRRLPGRVEYGECTLSYGLTTSTLLWSWMTDIAAGRQVRKNVSVVMLDSTGAEDVLRWELDQAWPRRWRGAPLDAIGSEVAIEAVTLVFEGIKRT